MEQRRTLSIRILLLTLLFFLIPYQVFAEEEALKLPSGDLTAPEVFHDPMMKPVVVGKPAEIRAKVIDNVGVKAVLLFFRRKDNGEYQRMKMNPEPGTDNFVAVLPAIDAPGLEYYIQATDLAGNTILRGHSFSPLTLTAKPSPGGEAPTGVAVPPPTKPEKKPGAKGMTYVWIGLGVLAAGALAASAGGDDGGGGTARDTTDVTITADVPGN